MNRDRNICPYCGTTRLYKRMKDYPGPRYLCRSCGEEFNEPKIVELSHNSQGECIDSSIIDRIDI